MSNVRIPFPLSPARAAIPPFPVPRSAARDIFGIGPECYRALSHHAGYVWGLSGELSTAHQ
jgi:hypothetical protein